MTRREFIAGLGAAAWPLAVRAQQPAMPVIGYLSSGSQRASAERLRLFLRGLNEAGYSDGKNITIEYRWAEGQYDRLPALAADLAGRNVRAIVVPDSVVTAQAAKAATSTIPVVFGIGADPVKTGLVTSLSRPGGNLTGAARMNVELEPKRLEMLHELVPTANTVALLVNPANPNAESVSKDTAAAARSLKITLHVLKASSDRDLDLAFRELVDLGTGGLVIAPDPFVLGRSARLAELALAYRIPAIFQYREFAAAGGLASYAGSPTESYRLIGLYTARILKGEKPADLPVQQYTKIEMIINLKTAKALGLAVPPSILLLADEVIEDGASSLRGSVAWWRGRSRHGRS
jgi:putative tryptophan/tyrosine transport system substrate-binding protein